MSFYNWRDELRAHLWEEGKVVRLSVSSYRSRVAITCSQAGRQKTVFANGEHNFFAYVELSRSDGSWIERGVCVVPVLPDKRIITVVEQRPAHFRFLGQPTAYAAFLGIEVDDSPYDCDISQFGPFCSLEFPGGVVDDETFSAAFLKELVEETEVGEQRALFLERGPRFFPQGADLALEMALGVIYLTNMNFSSTVANDGGLRVVALTEKEVEYNIQKGNIRSGQAALLAWYFYKEVKEFLSGSKKFARGYIQTRDVLVKKP